MKTLKLGDRGPDVVTLQMKLGLDPDGVFGPATLAEVKNFQTLHSLVADGIVGPSTWAALKPDFLKDDATLLATPLKPAKPVSGTTSAAVAYNNYGGLLTKLATLLQIPLKTLVAVVAVEASGAGFRDGKLVIRFENHVFWRQWGATTTERQIQFNDHFKFNQQEQWKGHQLRELSTTPWIEQHKNQQQEYQALQLATNLSSKDTACLCISMGAGQLMGFNHLKLGFSSAGQMFDQLQKSEQAQILSMMDFILLSDKAIGSLRDGTLTEFVKYYNGAGQVTTYVGWLQDRIAVCERLGL